MIKKEVTAIIPAFNEEKTIAEVVAAARGCSLVAEVIVVDDGSKDETANQAEKAGARVRRLVFNQGKGQAMHFGSRQAKTRYLLFLDADLTGLTSRHLDLLIEPVWRGEFDMAVGSIDRRRWGFLFLDFLKHSRLPLAGTRVVSRDFWESVPVKYKHKFYVESAVSYFAQKKDLKIKTLLLTGVGHLVKEKKRGPLTGLFSRVRMLAQILWINIFLKFF